MPHPRNTHLFPTRRSSDLSIESTAQRLEAVARQTTAGSTAHNIPPFLWVAWRWDQRRCGPRIGLDAVRQQHPGRPWRSEEHTSELQSRGHLVCRLLLEKTN